MALGLSIGSAYIGEGTVVEDYFFELSSSALQPLSSIIVDNSDIWDLDSDSNITPAASPANEGYFETDSNGDIQPYS